MLEDVNFKGVSLDLGQVVIKCISCKIELKLKYLIIRLIKDEFDEDINKIFYFIGCISNLFVEIMPNDHTGEDVLWFGIDIIEILLKEG